MGALYEKAQGPDLRLVHPSTSALLLTALLASLSYRLLSWSGLPACWGDLPATLGAYDWGFFLGP